MNLLTEKDIEAELTIEVLHLPDTQGELRSVKGYRFIWREFYRIINQTEADPFDIIELCAPIVLSGLIVSASWASGPLARCFRAQADDSPMSYAA